MLVRHKPSLRRHTQGISTVEYIIVLTFIAVSSVGLWKTFGDTVLMQVFMANNWFDKEVKAEKVGSGKSKE